MLTVNNPRLLDLKRRYRGHPAAAATAWNDARVSARVDLRFFRGDTEFVYQRRGNTHPAQYAWAADYVGAHDHLGLLDRLNEDGRFGAYLYEVAGRTVSRDLLDSVLEINALDRRFGLTSIEAPVILDIGAGYGRLAERMCAAFPEATYYRTDAVATPRSCLSSD